MNTRSQAKNIMVSSYGRAKEASAAKYISILNIIQGEVDPTQVSYPTTLVSCLHLVGETLCYLASSPVYEAQHRMMGPQTAQVDCCFC
jgi:hypothetical protein